MFIHQYSAAELGKKKKSTQTGNDCWYRVSFGGNGNILELDSDNSSTT